MRVLVINNLFPPHIVGGAEIMVRNIADGLKKRGHTVTVLTSWHGLKGPQQDDATWRTLRYIPSPHFNRRLPKWKQLGLLYQFYRGYHNQANAREIRRAVAAWQPDVVYLREIPGLGVNSLLQALRGLQVPVIFHPGSYWLQYTYNPETELSNLRLRWLKKMLIGPVAPFRYTSLIAVSKALKQNYIDMGCNADAIEVIYNGVDLVFTEPPPYKEGATDQNITRLLFVGRISVEKGILVLCKALDILVNRQGRRDILLDIVGTGDKSYLEVIHTYLEEKQLTPFVTFHGKVQQIELLRFYDRSDVMLVPSIWQEPFGLVVVEAMARNLPVIASKVGGPAEIITREKDGLLVPPGDEQALAEATDRLLTNQELRTRLAQNARNTVLNNFTLEECVQHIEKHLLRQAGTTSRY